MNIKSICLAATITIGLAISSAANAALIDRGNGMIYDTVQDITWLADANYAKTSGYDSDGRMTWAEANTWANNLEFGGFDDWRLINADSNDTNCSDVIEFGEYDDQYFGTNCTGNELGHLYYVDFEVTANQHINTSTSDNYDLFENIQYFLAAYWASNVYEPDTNMAWNFYNVYGHQTYSDKDAQLYAWAVRDGDISAPPSPVSSPGSLLLLGAGLIGTAVASRKKKIN